MARMTGAQALWAALAAKGVDTCFANPGTTELDMVRGLELRSDVRCVLGLQENICTGGADGYGRMTGRAAATLLHLGPGFANGIANLHNARRAHTPIVNVIGDHTSWHLKYDAPLTSDIESLARPVSGWVHRISDPGDIVPAAHAAVAGSRARGGQGATLIFPADFQAELQDAPIDTAAADEPLADEASASIDLAAAVSRLRAATHIVFLLGGGGEHSALGARGQCEVARLCEALGATAYAETFPSRSERGQGLPAFGRLPYFPEPARDVLDRADLVVLIGASAPITYFGYAGHPSALVETERLLVLSRPGEAVVTQLEQLADALQAPAYRAKSVALPEVAPGPLTPVSISAALACTLPKGAIVSVEGGTCGYPFYAVSAAAETHTTLTNTGGAIGQGLPVAMGAAIACPERTVVGLLSDGSTQYTVQALWTIAHENLDVVVLIAANHQYGILRNELRRDGKPLGARAETLTSLANPCIDWVGLARAYGVEASRAQTGEELVARLEHAFSRRGPFLIEMSL